MVPYNEQVTSWRTNVFPKIKECFGKTDEMKTFNSGKTVVEVKCDEDFEDARSISLKGTTILGEKTLSFSL